MALYPYLTTPNYNTSNGIQVLMQYPNTLTGGLFMNLILFAVFMVLAFGNYFYNKQRIGDADLSVSFASAGFVTAGFTILLSFVPGLINLNTLVIVIVGAILCAAWMFFGRD